MSDPQRTHKASPKRVKDFRKRGEIALSRDVVSAATLAGGVIALVATTGAATSAVMSLTRDAAMAADGNEATGIPSAALRTFFTAATPVMIGAAIAAVIAIVAQLGWPPVFKSIKLDLARLSPLTNLKSAFSLSGMARRTGSAVAKLVVVGAVVILTIRHGLVTHAMEAGGIGSLAWSVLMRAMWLVLGALALVAAVDYVLARRRMATQMKMTVDEVKREHRESDGDPMVKGKRRQKMRELAKRRIQISVAKADVVIVNPTHYAVALRYDESSDRAPIVVAKGMDELAEKIREVARKHAVPVLSRPPLARALHKNVKEGQPVPANLFRAVAEVLAYVYRLRGGGRS
ncbi:MAG: EscU/YscU/HrcU family type III secretion system export apparatus switch protein [Kofleriaceae bacterium]